MKNKHLPTQAELQCLFDYDPNTGKLFWKPRVPEQFEPKANRTAEHMAKVFNATSAGKEAFTYVALNGYRRGSIFGKMFYAHRVIWVISYGTEPDDVDHVNGDRSDNRLENLRTASRTENLQNRQLSRNNKSGHHGVSYSKRHKLWNVAIGSNGKTVHLGWFKEKDDAIAARKAAEITYGYHQNHGRSAHA